MLKNNKRMHLRTQNLVLTTPFQTFSIIENQDKYFSSKSKVFMTHVFFFNYLNLFLINFLCEYIFFSTSMVFSINHFDGVFDRTMLCVFICKKTMQKDFQERR